MTGSESGKSDPRSRLGPLVAALQDRGNRPYATLPDFAYLVELEKAVQQEVDRMVVELREEGHAFTTLSKWETFDWRAAPPAGDKMTVGDVDMKPVTFHPESANPWQAWEKRYRQAVKRLRGEDEEVLSLDALKQRRQQIKDLETQMRVGSIPTVERSAESQGESVIRAADLRRGDCVVEGRDGVISHLSRIVVRVECGVNPDGDLYVTVTYHDGVEYPYDIDYEFRFGSEANVSK